MKTKPNFGFTIIELLVVVSIIGLLASIVLVGVNSARAKARDSKRLSDVNQIFKGLELFYNAVGFYPTGTVSFNYVLPGGRVFGSKVLLAYPPGSGAVMLTPTYFGSLPSAPVPPDGNCTSNNNQYFYEANASGSFYTLSFCLGARTGSFDQGVRFLTPQGLK